MRFNYEICEFDDYILKTIKYMIILSFLSYINVYYIDANMKFLYNSFII